MEIKKEICGGCFIPLKHYDKVKRIVKLDGGYKTTIILNRMYCPRCKQTKRILPDYLIPYKHYSKDVILKYLDVDINDYYGDYPSDWTILRWQKENRGC